LTSPLDPLVVAISQGPTPYYTPILNALAEQVRLHVVYMSKGAKPGADVAGWADFLDTWGESPTFEHSFSPSLRIGLGRLDFQARLSAGVSGRLRRLNPDVILVHSWGPLMVEPLIWSRLAHKRTVMWTESSARTGLLRDPITGFARSRLVALVDAFVSTGTPATRFIENLGANPRRVIGSCLPSALGEAISAKPIASRPRPEMAGKSYLFVGRLVELKRPVELARAFVRALPSLGMATLTFVGDGPLRDQLTEMAGAAGGRIRIVGREEGEVLAARYVGADVLVIPSVREVWGLVVNEALAAGLFVVATDQVASAMDLLDEQSGLIIPADDPTSLVDALITAGEMGQSGADRTARRSRLAGCTRRAFATDLRRAIELALDADD
jgi:glycosyltransferase involved in cell wall biosynthesis